MLAGHFISSSQGQLFITQFGEVSGDTAILCLPSITEEMNLSRAVVAKTSSELSKITPVFVLDYFGTGDSSGEFEQATASIWIDDILNACLWLKSQGINKVIVWGVRFGALLALHAQKKIQEALSIIQFVFWKPVTNGKQFAGQFLRVKQANTMMNSGKKTNWRQFILDGNDTEVAGYTLNSAMLTSLESLHFLPEDIPIAPLVWFELSSKTLTPITKKIIGQWPENVIKTYAVECPMFWQIPEVFSIPDLTEQTYKAIAQL